MIFLREHYYYYYDHAYYDHPYYDYHCYSYYVLLRPLLLPEGPMYQQAGYMTDGGARGRPFHDMMDVEGGRKRT